MTTSASTPIPTSVVTTTTGRAGVSLFGVTKSYGDYRAVDHLDLEIRPGELFTLLGPSGSGKTTVLRLMAGLVTPSAGAISIGGRDVGEVPTHRRNLGMVFQGHALFPHLTVFDNIAFPLKMRRVPHREIAPRVAGALATVRLPDIAGRRIHELSGGQQQRVAFARALVYGPGLLLLDEPLGALDRQLREEMQIEIVRMHRDVEVTIVNVTHDQREAMMISDRIGVMQEGQLIQVGTAEELYQQPANRFVAQFLGGANLVDGVLQPGGGSVRTEQGLLLPVAGSTAPSGSCTVVLRPEVLRLSPIARRQAGALDGVVAVRAFEGDGVLYEVEVPGLPTPLRASVPGVQEGLQIGDRVAVSWDPAAAQVLVEPDAPTT